MAPRIARPTHRNGVSRAPLLHLHLSYAVRRRGLPAAVSFRRWIETALRVAGHGGTVELSVRIVGAREGRLLNRRYRGRDYATNVLSFPVELPAGVDLPLLGDIVLCAPVLAGEASAQGKRMAAHCAHLSIHGVLHLLGYDHRKRNDAARMEALEVAALAAVGIEDPYRPR